MNNLEYIRSLSLEELAGLLVHPHHDVIIDENCDGEPIELDDDGYIIPDGSWYWDFESARHNVIAWLKQEVDPNASVCDLYRL